MERLSEKKRLIALQAYSLRNEASQDFAGTMRKVKEMGYDGVELAGTYGMAVAEVKAVLDGIGLTLVSAHVPIEQLEDDAVLDAYAGTGLRYVAIPWLTGPKDAGELATTVWRIRKAGERCRAKGLQLLYHNHDFEFEQIDGRYILEAYYSEIPAELLQTELDLCWVRVGGEEPCAYLRRYAGRAPVVHLKDYSGRKTANMYGLIGREGSGTEPSGKFEYRPVGYGVQDIPSLVAAADDAGCGWIVAEQDDPGMGLSSMECVEMSIHYLKSFL